MVFRGEEVDPELSSFRSEPESFFSTEITEMWSWLPRLDKTIVDPPEARAGFS
jgi:hypothetical protein